MHRTYEEWRLTHPPIMGGAEDDDPPADPPADPPTDPPADPPVDDEPVTILSNKDAKRLLTENQRLMREQAAQAKDRRLKDAEAKKADDERKAKAGEWQKLAEEARAERDEVQRKFDDLVETVERDKQRTSVEKVADTLNFRRPRRAYMLLADELDAETLVETLANEQLIQAALKRIARAEPELVDNQRRSGAPVNGKGGRDQDPQRQANSLIASLLGGNAPQD